MTSGEGRIGFRVYLITDRKLFTSEDLMVRGIGEALRAGVKAVQLREKDMATRDLLALAYRLRELTKEHGAALFINDRVDIAMAAEADGVHLGGTSVPVSAARKAAGEKLLIGRSAHSLEEALEAEKDGADLMTFGPVFDTPSKRRYGKPVGLELLGQVARQVSAPVFAIGGITMDSIQEIQAAGAHGIALISGILASDTIYGSAINFVRTMT
ncbi:MAG: thiamine phosphate synthase [Nitrospirae bacterium]|nr:MAG: thiamine phosphate synthase [Nitrospirota bacterium]